MRTQFHFESVGVQAPSSRLHGLKKMLFLRTLRDRYLRRLFTIDETLDGYVRQRRPKLAAKLQYVPDPVELTGTRTRAQARLELRIPEDSAILLVYGALSLRKGIDTLLGAARQAGFPKRVRILLAGKQDAQVRGLLASTQARILRDSGQLYEYDRFLSDEEEYTVFRAADAVWLGYRDHYAMSGVLVQAGMMGMPVLSCEAGLIGWLTRRYRLGLTVPIDDVGAVTKTIAMLMQAPEVCESYGKNGRLFSERHRPQEFARTVAPPKR